MTLDRQSAQAYLAEEVRHEAMDIDRNAAGIGRQKTIGYFTIPIPPKKDAPAGIPSAGEGVQVAGLGPVVRMMMRNSDIRTGKMLDRQRENIAAPTQISEADAGAMRAAKWERYARIASASAAASPSPRAARNAAKSARSRW